MSPLDPENRALLVCVPWEDRIPEVPAFHSECVRCATVVSVALSSRPVYDAGAQVVCVGCVDAVIGDEVAVVREAWKGALE